MPFTVSHAAFALPFRSRRLDVPACGLAIGAMSPDLEYLIAGRPHRTIGHDLFGIVTLDLALALAALAAMSMAAPGLATLVPRRWAEVRRRVDTWRAPLWPIPRLVGLVAAILIGASTHVVIDAFTHSGSWGARRIAWLREPTGIGNLTGAYMLQLGLSLVGGVALLAILWRWLGDVGLRRPLRTLPWTQTQLAVVSAATVGVLAATGWNQIHQPGTGSVRWDLAIAFLGAARASAVALVVVGLVLRLPGRPGLRAGR